MTFDYVVVIIFDYVTICKQSLQNFHNRTVQLDIIKVYSPTDAQENRFKRSIKIYTKTAPSSGSALFERAKVTVIKTVN